MHEISIRVSHVAATVAIAGTALLGAGTGHAQNSYPDRPIRLIVPFPPGGQTDNVSRQLDAALTPVLGQQLVIDNRGGASGTIGSAEAVRAKPDGYTLLMSTASTHAIMPNMMAKIPYDAVRDFVPIIVISTGPMTISVHPSVPVRNLKQLVADIKSKPDLYSYGTAGVGSVNHLGGELFKQRAGNLKVLHVPYKGAGPVMQELIGGQIPMACTSLSSVLPHHRSGRIRTLAVMKEERSVGAPEIPTTAEGGVPGAIAYTYNIVLAPAGTPRSAIDQLSNAMRKVMTNPSLIDSLVRLGVDPVKDSTPDKAAAMLKAELERWRPIIESLGLKQ